MRLLLSVKPILYLFVLLGMFTGLSAQEIPSILQQRLEGKTTLKAIMKEVDSFYIHEMRAKKNVADKEEEFENPYTKWKRWERYMRSRLGPNGEFVNIASKNQEAIQQLPSNGNGMESIAGSTTASWSFSGPYFMTYFSSSYRGQGRIDVMAFHPTDPNIIYVGAPNGGLWRTTDGGLSWICLTHTLPSTGVAGIAVSNANPNVIYMLTGDRNFGGSFFGAYNSTSNGLWKTTDGGGNWYKMADFPGLPINNIYVATKLLMDPTNNNILYVAANNSIYKTINGGMSWITLPPFGTFFDMEFKPGNPSIIYASASNVIFYTTNAGTNWNSSTFDVPLSGVNRIEIAVSPADASQVWIICGPASAGQFKGIYKSINSGVFFNRVLSTPNILGSKTDGSDADDQSWYDLAIAISPTNINTIVTGGLTVWSSIDGGASIQWATTYSESGNLAFYIHPDIHDVAFNPLNGFLYAATDGGFYRSTDNGVAWSDFSAGLHTTMFYTLSGFNGDANKLMGGTQDNGLKYKKDASVNFYHIMGGDGFDAVIDPTNSSRAYTTSNASTRRFINDGVMDAIITPFGVPDNQGSYFAAIDADPVTSNIVYVAYPLYFFKSTNAGASWTQKGAGYIGDNRAFVVSPSNANRIFIAGPNRLYRSDNGGDNWTGDLTLNPGFNYTGDAIEDIKVCPTNSNLVWIAVGGYTAGQKVYYSTDAGGSWINLSGTLPNVPVHSIAIDNGNNAYIGTEIGVFYQAANRADWTPYYNNLPRVPVSELVINQAASIIRAATYGRGVYEAPLFSGCDVNALISGDLTGEKFYEVSNQIVSDANIFGGTNTKVIYQAGVEVVFTNGFIVNEGSQIRTLLKGCETGPVPIINGPSRTDLLPSFSKQLLPSNQKTNFPYGSVRVGFTNAQLPELEITINTPGLYTIRLMRPDGTVPEGFTGVLENYQQGVYHLNLKSAAIPKGLYYVGLYYNDELVHFQEFNRP